MTGPSVEPIGDSDETPWSLLARIKANDPEAWDELVRRYQPWVQAECRRGHVPPADTEDQSHEVFLAVFRRLPDFHTDRAGDSLRGWLWTITRHKIDDWHRRHQRQPEPGPLPEAIPAPSRGEEPATEATANTLLYQRALELIEHAFAKKTRLAFWLVVVEGQEPREVAKKLRLSVNAVYLAKSRVLQRLREELGAEAEAAKGGQPRGEKPSGGPGPTEQPVVKGSPEGDPRRPAER